MIANLPQIHLTFETVLAVLTVASLLGTALVKVRNHIKRMSQGLDDLLVLPAQVNEMHQRMGAIEAQLKPNGGSSVVDRLNVAVGVLETNTSTLDGVSRDVHALARKQQAALHLNDKCLMEFDVQGHCTFVNRAFLRLTGRTEHELTGTGWVSAFRPESRRVILDAWDAAVDSHSSMETPVTLASVGGRTTEGTIQFTAVFSRDNGLIGWLGSFTPVDSH
jgi:PAS domain S-box-containing protein